MSSASIGSTIVRPQHILKAWQVFEPNQGHGTLMLTYPMHFKGEYLEIYIALAP